MKLGNGLFDRFANQTAWLAGRPFSFGLAVLVVAVWLVTGPIFHFSDTWQLVINTGTTIITFMMVFLIQNTQNREAQAVQLKLDELIRATRGAHVALMDIEELSERELRDIRKCYCRLAAEGRKGLRKGDRDTGTPAIDVSHFRSKGD
ncbi:low affinity iron permease family protein [bacterium]|nr:low affinity iron permease family protein [bacterium]